MVKDRTVALLAVGVAAAYILLAKQNMQWQKSSTGKMFYVKALPDALKAADHLEQLQARGRTFVKKALEIYPDDPRVRRLADRWPGTLSEVEDRSSNVAYSLGKSAIHMCVREKDGTVTDLNTSMFVLIHEFAHVASEKYGHTKAFWKNMKFLLEIAEKVGVYTYVNHESQPAMYCGRNLGTSPITCVKEKDCDSELA